MSNEENTEKLPESALVNDEVLVPEQGIVGDETLLGFEDRTFSEEMRQAYLSYAMSVIVGRALPDVRDGLKPVHRRVLYTMYKDGVLPNKPFNKSAATVGECLGKFHPHGDASVYDTMVRMAQSWRLRGMLVEGQGNMGSIDGDGAAAARYTEARLSKLSLGLLDGLESDTVDFRPNYDGRHTEPTVLPARFPNLLVNGSEGIAVGMATSIPPHNLREVSAAVAAMIDNPDISVDELMEYMPAPDFPTGGLIVGRSGVREGYATGRGRTIVRAVCHVESRGGGRERIVVTEMPYGIQKGDGRGDGSGLMKKIVQLVNDKKLPEIVDIRDESSQDIRLVIELRAGSIPQVVLNKLYKHTSLQTSVPFNMVVLHHGQPQLMGLKPILKAYVEHQVDVVTRRARHELDRIRRRAHILEGLLIAMDHMDVIIALIRESETTEEAREELISRYKLTEIQAEAILDMKLRALARTDADSVKAEYSKLTERIGELRALLGSEQAILDTIKEELAAFAIKHGDDRRSKIIPAENAAEEEDLIPEETIVVTLTSSGYLKRTALEDFRAQSRGGTGARGLALADKDDSLILARVVSTHEWLLAFTDKGRVWRMRGWQIPEGSKTSQGRSLANLLALDEGEKIVALCNTETFEEGKSLMFATRNGLVKRTPLPEYDTIFKSRALKAITLVEDDALVSVKIADDDNTVLVATSGGRGQHFPVSGIRAAGRSSRGVRAMKVAAGDEVIGLTVHDGGKVLMMTASGKGKRTEIEQFRVRRRGGLGVKAITLEEGNRLIGVSEVADGDELLAFTKAGMVVRTKADTVSTYSRTSKGVRVMRVAKGDEVVLLCLIGVDQLKAVIEEDEEDATESVVNAAVVAEIDAEVEDIEDDDEAADDLDDDEVEDDDDLEEEVEDDILEDDDDLEEDTEE